MSLDILKERFGGKLITSQYEDKIEIKEKIIEKLEEETNNLSNQVVNLENEKNTLLQELNKARHFEEGTFSIKEKDYVNKIQSKENVIKELKSEFSPLYEKIEKQKDRLSHKDDLLKKHIKVIKELNKKINKLDYKLNYEKNNSKEVISEIKSERKKTYQEYINNLDIYENTIISKNDMINNYKTKLQESLDKLKEASNLIINLKKDIKINENVREELREKKEEITNLNGQVYSLSKEVKHLSSLSEENSILEAKLEKTHNFENSILRVDEYVSEIKVKDDIINEKKQDLLESIKQINNLSTKIDNLQSKNKQDEETIENLKSTVKENKDSFISQNDDFENVIKKKDNYIIELKKETETLSEKVIVLSELAKENSILEAKLEKAQSFQDVIINKKDKFNLKETNNLSTFKLVSLLTSISREKQGSEKLTWNDWLKIPESNYLFQLDETIAKKIFNESQMIADKSRISLKANLNEARHYTTGRGDEPDLTLEPLKISGLLFYGNRATAKYSSVTDADWGVVDEVSQISDLSGNDNHLVTMQTSHSGDTSGLKDGTTAIGNPHIDTGSNGIRFGYRDPQDSPSKADRMSFTNTMLLDGFTAFYVLQQLDNGGDDADGETEVTNLGQAIGEASNNQIFFRGNYSGDGGNVITIRGNDGSDSDAATVNASSDVEYSTKFLLTIKKASYADGGLMTTFINKTNVGTSDGFTKDVDVKINMIGDESFAADAFDLFEMAYYNKELTDDEILRLQKYFIQRQGLVDNFQ